MGQLATAAKSNEIPAARTLLATFDLSADGGVVVTVDAMHTQTDTAQAITEAGGDYVFTVKANQPKLSAACKNLPGPRASALNRTRPPRVVPDVYLSAPRRTGMHCGNSNGGR